MSATDMNESVTDHPSEEQLERFLLNMLGGVELELLETHILSCNDCVSRLQKLEIEIAAKKLALSKHLDNEPALAQRLKHIAARRFL